MENYCLSQFAQGDAGKRCSRRCRHALLVMLTHQPVEQPHAESRSPAPIDLAVGRRKSSASDIEMRPCRSLLDEALEELRGRDRAAPFAAGVLYVSNLGIDHLVV